MHAERANLTKLHKERRETMNERPGRATLDIGSLEIKVSSKARSYIQLDPTKHQPAMLMKCRNLSFAMYFIDV